MILLLSSEELDVTILFAHIFEYYPTRLSSFGSRTTWANKKETNDIGWSVEVVILKKSYCNTSNLDSPVVNATLLRYFE